jgi:uncharacterized protein YecE (DUF72 family)
MLLIGTSGYNYPHWWNGVFYPPRVPQRLWLEYYARHFNTVEVNVSFYRLPQKEIFKEWYRRTPKEFAFTVKGSWTITHARYLKDCRDPLGLLLDHASPLKEKLGGILWQLPPKFKFMRSRLEEFCVLLSTLPRSRRLRHTFEFMDESWYCPEAFRVLEEFDFTYCIAHGSSLPLVEKVTSGSIYLRLRGGESLHGASYSDKELVSWASKILEWRKKGKTVFAYFNNDAYGFAVKNALSLKRFVSTYPSPGLP